MSRPTDYIEGTIILRPYEESHPGKLIELMEQGRLDAEIYASFGISERTFYRWLKEHPDLAEAREIGMPKCEAWWLAKIRTHIEAGDDDGFKYAIGIMNNKFGWGKGENAKTVHNTQINVNQMQIVNSKEDYDKLSLGIQEKLKELNLMPQLALIENNNEKKE